MRVMTRVKLRFRVSSVLDVRWIGGVLGDMFKGVHLVNGARSSGERGCSSVQCARACEGGDYLVMCSCRA